MLEEELNPEAVNAAAVHEPADTPLPRDVS
jgi:hypothetical protein